MATPLGRVRGLGSARTGTGDYLAKQFSGFLLAFLTPWMIIILIMLVGRPYQEVIASLKSLWVAPPVAAFILVTIYHMQLGMRVVIEDYVHGERLKTLSLILNWIFCWGLGLVCLFALLRIFVT